MAAISSTSRPASAARRPIAALAALAVLGGLGAAAAAPKPVIVLDLFGEPDVRDQATAVSLLVKSQLDGAPLPTVPRAKLLAAVKQLRGKSSRYALLLEPARAAELATKLSASWQVSGTLVRKGSRLLATVELRPAGEGKTQRFTASTPHGRVGELALALADKLRRALGDKPPDRTGKAATATPVPAFGPLLPHVRATHALLAEQPILAAHDLRIALGATLAGHRLPKSARAAAEPARLAASSLAIPAVDRLTAALVTGDQKLVRRLASEIAKRPSASDLDKRAARAARALAALAASDLKTAAEALRGLDGRKVQLAGIARVALLDRQGRSGKANALLTRLIKRDGYLPALARVAYHPEGAPPPPRLLAAAFGAARKLDARRHAGLVSQLSLMAASRAEELRVPLATALDRLRASMLSQADRDRLAPLVERAVKAELAVGYRLRAELLLLAGKPTEAEADLERLKEKAPDDALGRRLLAWIKLEQGKPAEAAKHLEIASANGDVGARIEYARALELAGDKDKAQAIYRDIDDEGLVEARATALATSRAIDAAVGPEGAVARALDRERLRELVQDLGRAIAAFPPLRDNLGARIVLAPLAGSAEPVYFPHQVHPQLLGEALRQALSPRDAVVHPRAVQRLVRERLSALAVEHYASGVLLYRLRASLGGRAKVELVYFSARETGKGALEYKDQLRGRYYGLVSWNPPFLYGVAGLGLLALLWIGLRFARGTGEVKVKIALDAAADQPAYKLVLDKKPDPPAISDPEAFHRKTFNASLKQTRYTCVGVKAFCRLTGVPAGDYHAHLIGTFYRGGDLRQLPVDLSQKIHVNKNSTTNLNFDLDPKNTDLRVLVFDDNRPIHNAEVWLDTNPAKRFRTDARGEVMIAVPRRQRVTVHIKHRDFSSQRSVHYDDARVQVLSINLDKERKMDALRGGIELDRGDAPPPPAAPANGLSLPSLDPSQGMIAPALSVPGPGAPPLAAVPTGPQRPSAILAPDAGMPAVSAELPAAPRQPGAAGAAIDRTVGMWGGQGPAPSPSAPPAAAGPAAPLAATEAGPPGIALGAMPSGPAIEVAGNSGGMQRYQRTVELGRGAMGVVYKARDTVLERDVALKVIGEELREHPQVQAMFLQEAKALARLNHPNIVTVYDQGEDGPFTFMVMEFVDGQTLETVIEANGRLPLDRGLQLADQLCAGMSYAHARKILHRDIKPENIFLTGDGIVKIGDFGLARVLHELSIKRTEIRGTPLYMAPEQIRGTDIDFRADIYALGCSLFAAFTGRPPFIEGEILYHHLHTAPPRPSSLAKIPAELEQLILACIAKEKQQRIASVDALRDGLKPLLAKHG